MEITSTLGVLVVWAAPALLALLNYKLFRYANKKWKETADKTLVFSFWLAVKGGFLVGLVVSILMLMYVIYGTLEFDLP